MSKLGIAFFYIALAGALAAAIGGYLLIENYQLSQATLAQTEQSLVVSKKQTVDTQKKLDTTTATLNDTQTELTATKGKVDDLNTKLTAAQKMQDDLNTQLTAAKADVDKAKQALQHVSDVLGTMSPEETKAAMLKAQADLAASQGREKILQDQIQAQTKAVADLHDEINRKPHGTMPPGISGKITFVNRAWNFVVLNVGLSNGVVPNGELIVYRNRTFLGKIKVTSAEDGTSVADILPGAKADIQIGDIVIN